MFREHGQADTDKIMEFSNMVKQKLQEQQYTPDMDAPTQYKCMNTAIQHAIDTTVPVVERSGGIKRNMSKETEHLFQRRTSMKGCTQGQFDILQDEIRKSTLQDYTTWVEEHYEHMNEANGLGDTRAIYKSVKTLSGKKQKPSKNLTTDGQGHILSDAKEVAARWYDFLSKKFAATKAETETRQAYEPLGPTQGEEPLSEEEILAALARLKSGKTTGPDGVPVEIYQKSDICKKLLVTLLKRIWQDEAVPTEFGEARFIMLYKNKGSSDDPSKYRCLGL